MRQAVSIRPRLRTVAGPFSAQQVSQRATAMPMQADWQRMLRDITRCGLLRLEIGNTVATLKSLGEPWYADVAGHAAWLSGPGMALAGLTDRWAVAAITRSDTDGRFDRLEISDYFGNRVLRLMLTEDSNWDGFKTLLVRQWARPGAPLALPGGVDLRPALEHLQTHAGMRLVGPLYDNWYDAARRHYPGSPVDASLLAPFLETFIDQVCPLNLALGNVGLLQQQENVFHDCHQHGALLRLRSNTAEFALHLDRVVGARLCRCNQRAGGAIRLYDENCRCAAVISPPLAASASERELWEIMLRALRD
jgi:hypothetical protein